MRSKKSHLLIDRIIESKKQGFIIEALVLTYHLNSDLLRQLCKLYNPEIETRDKKPKTLIKALLKQIELNADKKSSLNKKNLKAVKAWLETMDSHFKNLKAELPRNTKSLLHASEQASAIINIALNKPLT